MAAPKPMLTLSQVMTKLAQKKGIHREFRMNENGEMRLQDADYVYQPSDLSIVKVYRFEGDSNPDDNVALYVVKDHLENKGIIIDNYGADSNYPGDEFDKFLRSISEEDCDEYNIEDE